MTKYFRKKLSHIAFMAVAFLFVFSAGIGVGWYHCLLFPTVGCFQDVVGERVGGSDADRSSFVNYSLNTSRYSYFKLDSQGFLELEDGLPVRAEDVYRFERTIYPQRTAVVVMDPWVDMASEHLNEYFSEIIESRIVPFLKKAIELGHPILILTNDPKSVDYNSKIHDDLESLVAFGKAELLFHQDMDDELFAAFLRSKGVDSLIYVGFASNMCVIGREMGMINMVQQGLKLYFVSEASGAVEYLDSWDDRTIHMATTRIISQWVAELIDYEEYLGLVRAVSLTE